MQTNDLRRNQTLQSPHDVSGNIKLHAQKFARIPFGKSYQDKIACRIFVTLFA